MPGDVWGDATGTPHHVEAIPVGSATLFVRSTYLVVCHSCRAVLWHLTTAPTRRIGDHLAGRDYVDDMARELYEAPATQAQMQRRQEVTDAAD